MTVIEKIAKRFPQLYLEPGEGVSKSDLYRAIVLRGASYTGSLDHFNSSPEDSLSIEKTPCGEVSVVYLANRADFECFYRIIACRCEPVEVPPTMGACYIGGINDWSKINHHMEDYKAAGGEDTKGEFSRFTSVPSNYKESILLLSKGPYSALSAQQTPYGQEEWVRLSHTIRKYHELTHFVCRKLFPEKKYPLWDELLADCMGLVFAVGDYNQQLAQAFLGITNGSYTGGRLENYTDGTPDPQTVAWVVGVTEALCRRCREELSAGNSGYSMMEALERDAEAICGGKLF